MTPRVLFRADGGPVIGMGHLMRCRTLAVELRKIGWDVTFCGDGIPVGFGPPSGAGFDVRRPDGALRDMARDLGARLLIVDSYAFSTGDLQALRHPERLLAAIDDLADRELPVDAVVNPNPRFDPAPYERQGIPLRMVGTEAVLVRPEVVALRPAEPVLRPTGPVLFTLGGGDVEDLMLRMLEAIGIGAIHEITVSVTPHCPVSRLRAWEAADPGRRRVNADPALFPRLLSEAGFVVSGGGTTLWEVYALGIPSLAVVHVENQSHSLTVARQAGTSLCLDLRAGPGADSPAGLPGAALRGAFQTLTGDSRAVREMIERQRALIDGQGAARVASRLDRAFREGIAHG